jgi:hypothetical protein
MYSNASPKRFAARNPDANDEGRRLRFSSTADRIQKLMTAGISNAE